jgi:hypothetical protein
MCTNGIRTCTFEINTKTTFTKHMGLVQRGNCQKQVPNDKWKTEVEAINNLVIMNPPQQ